MPPELVIELARAKRDYDRALAHGALGTGTLPSCEALSVRVAELSSLAEEYVRLMSRIPEKSRK